MKLDMEINEAMMLVVNCLWICLAIVGCFFIASQCIIADSKITSERKAEMIATCTKAIETGDHLAITLGCPK